MDGIIIGVN